VGVVDRLTSRQQRSELCARKRGPPASTVESYAQRQLHLVPYAEAYRRRFHTDWTTVRIDTPSFLGVRVLRDFPLEESSLH